jgi:hypothetical protein
VHSANMPVPRLALASVATSEAASEKRPWTSGATGGGFLERTDPTSLSPQMLQLRCSTRGSPRTGFSGGARGSMAGTTLAFIETLSRQKQEQEQQEQAVRAPPAPGGAASSTQPRCMHPKVVCTPTVQEAGNPCCVCVCVFLAQPAFLLVVTSAQLGYVLTVEDDMFTMIFTTALKRHVCCAVRQDQATPRADFFAPIALADKRPELDEPQTPPKATRPWL